MVASLTPLPSAGSALWRPEEPADDPHPSANELFDLFLLAQTPAPQAISQPVVANEDAEFAPAETSGTFASHHGATAQAPSAFDSLSFLRSALPAESAAPAPEAAPVAARARALNGTSAEAPPPTTEIAVAAALPIEDVPNDGDHPIQFPKRQAVARALGDQMQSEEMAVFPKRAAISAAAPATQSPIEAQRPVSNGPPIVHDVRPAAQLAPYNADRPITANVPVYPGAAPAAEMLIAPPPAAAIHQSAPTSPAPAVPNHQPQFVIATSIRKDDGAIELRLDPPDLGSLRIEFSTHEDGLVTAVISAERAETLDIARRNIDAFKQELTRFGLGDVAFEFAGQDAGESPFDRDDRQGRRWSKPSSSDFGGHHSPFVEYDGWRFDVIA